MSIQGQSHFLTLANGHLHIHFSQKPLVLFYQILYVSFKVQGIENMLIYCLSHEKMASLPIYSKNQNKTFFFGTKGPFP